MKNKLIGVVVILLAMLSLAIKNCTAKSNVDEETIKIASIYQKVQQAQYMKRMCDYFIDNKNQLDALYKNSGIVKFEAYIPSKYNSLLNSISKESDLINFMEKMNSEQREEFKNVCQDKYPEMLKEIEINLLDWISLVELDIQKENQ
jgi:short-subunit dehydrogenase involved in D-alanine esterification of teichoic acids